MFWLAMSLFDDAMRMMLSFLRFVFECMDVFLIIALLFRDILYRGCSVSVVVDGKDLLLWTGGCVRKGWLHESHQF
jgi:hypothetical protein